MNKLHTLGLALLSLLIAQAWAAEAPGAAGASPSTQAADAELAANTLPLVRVQGSKESATGPVPGFVACLARGDCFYGQRRTLNATLSYRF